MKFDNRKVEKVHFENLGFAITISIINFQPGSAGPNLEKFTTGRGPETGIILKAVLSTK